MAQSKLSPDSPGRLAPLQRAADERPPAEKPKRALRNTKLRRIRALRIIEYRAVGWSNSEIAEALRLTADHVREELVWADKNGLLEEAEQRVLEQMVPKAFDVIMERMKTQDALGLDLRAAGLVVGVLKDLQKAKTSKEARKEDREFDVAKYLADRAERNRTAGTEVTVERLAEEESQGLLPPHGDAEPAVVVAEVIARADGQGDRKDSGVHDPAARGSVGPADHHRDDSPLLAG